MLIVTTDTIPGYDITAVYGEVFGLGVRGSVFGVPLSGGHGLDGKSTPAVTRALVDSRALAMGRLSDEARSRGANAIVGLRLEVGTAENGMATQIWAYGTAVVVAPVTATA